MTTFLSRPVKVFTEASSVSFVSGDAMPTTRLEIGDGHAQLELQDVLGVEVAVVIAADSLQLSVDGLNHVGGQKLRRTASGYLRNTR